MSMKISSRHDATIATVANQKGHGPVLLPRKKGDQKSLDIVPLVSVRPKNKSREGKDSVNLPAITRERVKQDQLELFSDFSFNDNNGFVLQSWCVT